MPGSGEAALAAELKRTRALLDAIECAARAGVAAVDMEGRQTHVSEGFCRMLGWSAAELLGARPPFRYWPEDERGAIEAALAATIEGRAPAEGFDLVFRRRDGARLRVRVQLAPLLADDGRPDGWVATVADVTEQRRVEQALSDSRRQLEEAQRLARAGSWQWRVSTNEVTWSDELYRIYGLQPGEAPATFEAFISRVHPDDRDATRSAIRAAVETGEPFEFEERIVRPDGSTATLLSIGRLIRDADGRPERLIGSCQDVTERKQAEQQRAELVREQVSRAEAEKASRSKDEFLAMLSHELRTPLNAILGWAHVLQSADLDEAKHRRAVETIRRCALLQSQLISDMLDIHRITSGKLRLAPEPVPLGAFLAAAADAARPAALARSVAIDVRADAEACALADPDRLQQVVGNLLSNAIRFAGEGGHVAVRATRAGPGVEITVQDDGPGIDAAFLPFVFEPFRQSDAPGARAHGGLGLGLAIVRRLVEMHGGTVGVANGTPGALFTVRLPAATPVVAPAARVLGPGRRAGTSPSLRGLRIVVVDDDADSRSMAAAVLEGSGAEVVVATSAAEGVEAVRRVRPDVLVSDIEMPGEDGYRLIADVRALAVGDGGLTPAAALTAYAGLDDRIRALDAGFQVHVPKPVDPAELVAVVASLGGTGGLALPASTMAGRLT